MPRRLIDVIGPPTPEQARRIVVRLGLHRLSYRPEKTAAATDRAAESDDAEQPPLPPA